MNKHLPLIASLSLAGSLYAQDKPNILWLTFEDTSPQFIGCYGNAGAKTPAMDALAGHENGVRFNYAYSNSSVSSPSRSCIITGMDVNIVGTGNHRYNRQIPDNIKGFPYYLRQSGYYTTNNVKTDYNIKNSNFISNTWNESSATAHWRKRPTPDTPFFSVFNINYSHQSYTTQGTYKYYLDEVFKVMQEQRKSSENEIIVPPFYHDDDEMRTLMCRLQNCINYTDQVIGEKIDELKSDGLDKNTIIFVFADHGEGMPRGKTCALGLGYRVPFIAWFPDKWKHLNPFDEKVVDNTQICFEDLAPTILNLTGVNIPSHLDGVPFFGENTTDSREYVYASRNRISESPGIERSVIKGKYVYTRVFSPYLPTVKNQGYDYNCDIQRHIRKNTFFGNLNEIQLEPFQARQTEYLYDLENDKWEVENLAANPVYANLLTELRNEMIRYAVKIKDIGFMPEYEMQKRSSQKLPMEIRNDMNMEKIISTALLTGGGASVLSEQLELLDNEDPLVRYWASVGIYNQGNIAISYKKELEEKLQNETFDAARLELASFLYNFCDVEACATIVKDYAKGSDELLAAEAIIKIQYFGEKTVLFKDFIDEVKTHWNQIDEFYTASPAANVTQIIINEKLNNPISDSPQDNASYQIRNTITGGYLSVKNGATINSPTQQTLSPGEESLWQLKKGRDNLFYIMKNDQLALEMTNVKTNGISPELKSYNSTTSQQLWKLEPYQYGYKIINSQTERGIQVNSQSKAEGAKISQWDWTGSPHFTWILENKSLTNIIESKTNKTNILNIYPNPVSTSQPITISFVLYETTSYSINLYTLEGKKVFEQKYPIQIPGEYYINQVFNIVKKGTFILTLECENAKTRSSLLIIK